MYVLLVAQAASLEICSVNRKISVVNKVFYYYNILLLLLFITDPPKMSPSGPTVASLKSECGTKFGQALKKGWVKWSSCYLVLKQSGDTLYEYRTDLVRCYFTS